MFFLSISIEGCATASDDAKSIKSQNWGNFVSTLTFDREHSSEMDYNHLFACATFCILNRFIFKVTLVFPPFRIDRILV